jgi:hypothetical protein
VPLAALTDPEVLQAVGGIGSFLATIGLLAYAAVQVKHVREQSEATERQAVAAREEVELLRAAGLEEEVRRNQERSEREGERRRQDDAVRRQVDALVGVAQATLDAARAQVQPVVFAHAHGGALRGPNDDFDLAEDKAAALYYLTNEGTGLALDLEHGVLIAEAEYAFGGGLRFRAARPGEMLPPLPASGERRRRRSELLAVDFPLDVLEQARRARINFVYWCRFSNVFGEQFETQNSLNPAVPATLRRLSRPEVPRP